MMWLYWIHFVHLPSLFLIHPSQSDLPLCRVGCRFSPIQMGRRRILNPCAEIVDEPVVLRLSLWWLHMRHLLIHLDRKFWPAFFFVIVQTRLHCCPVAIRTPWKMLSAYLRLSSWSTAIRQYVFRKCRIQSGRYRGENGFECSGVEGFSEQRVVSHWVLESKRIQAVTR